MRKAHAIRLDEKGSRLVTEVRECNSPVTPQTLPTLGNRNPALEFMLAGYNNPAAMPGDPASPIVAAESIMAMYCHARFLARRKGEYDGCAAEEAVGRTFEDVGKSRLCQTYQPNPCGVKPWVNYVLRCRLGDVLRERQKERTAPLPTDVQSRESGPAAIAAISEMEQKCADLISRTPAKPFVQTEKTGSSTQDVRKHRERKHKWRQVQHLFPDMSFRPKSRRRSAQ